MTAATVPVERTGVVRALVAGGLAAAVVVVLLVALFGGGAGGPMTSDDAVTFTERALEDAGVEATVGEPTAGTFTTGGAEEDVWVVPARVDGREIELSVEADGDKALNLADVLPDGSNVLDEEQFDALSRFRLDPRDEDTTVPGALAALAALAVWLLLAGALRTDQAAPPSL